MKKLWNRFKDWLFPYCGRAGCPNRQRAYGILCENCFAQGLAIIDREERERERERLKETIRPLVREILAEEFKDSQPKP